MSKENEEVCGHVACRVIFNKTTNVNDLKKAKAKAIKDMSNAKTEDEKIKYKNTIESLDVAIKKLI